MVEDKTATTGVQEPASLERRITGIPLLDRLLAFGDHAPFGGRWPADLALPDFDRGLRMEETEDAYTARLEMPGVIKDDISIEHQGRLVTVHASSYSKQDEREERREYSYRFRTPSAIDAANASAQYKDGMLELTLPKAAQPQTKQIPIKTGE